VFFCFFWLVTVFLWILFKRFQVMQQSVIQALLDKERIEKEKEIERGQLIEKQNAELEQRVERRTAELKSSLEELKTTQKQLIQSEKMASLGELTAGIAHEIQNPLNFVNNFSEVSMEMLDEMKLELKTGNQDEAISIADDIEQNLEKIIHHGKRADGIVKGMLQHSRAGSDTKEPTDINVLADEYLRLAYHGLRAKNKDFNADLVTAFDEKLPKANAVPQDIGRVLLNLLTNAFYAVQQKQKTAGSGYKPTITLTTKLITPPLDSGGRGVEIAVKDNGSGIPESVKNKIMQPFFTTKPTGEGTGLGLSMSYDIIVKGHGGNIEVDTKEGEYTRFIITIPL
jgi:signal transduction histidine kinase